MTKPPSKEVGPPQPRDPKKIRRVEHALILSGGNKREAAQLAGVSEPSLYAYINKGWISRDLVEKAPDLRSALEVIAEQYRTEVAWKAQNLAQDAIDVAGKKIEEASPKDAAIIAGVMIDKAELLAGRPTARHSVEITGDLEVLKRLGIIKFDDVDGEVLDEDEVVIG